MTRNRRPSPQTVSVLRALFAEPATWRYGYELGRQVGLKAGSLYPILIRLTERELLESRWEEQSEASAGRPPRHLYRLTGAGLEWASQLAPAPAQVARSTGDGRPHGALRSA
jgi:PadR family transcriptional regulator, regulatory protein PadR